MLADRPSALAAVTRIFLAEIERLLCAAAGVTSDAPAFAVRPRLGAVSVRHRFGSVLNHHVHLHVCATDGVFMPAADGAGCDGPPAFLPVRPITQVHLAVRTERVRRRVIRWFRLAHLLDASAAAAMLAWERLMARESREWHPRLTVWRDAREEQRFRKAGTSSTPVRDRGLFLLHGSGAPRGPFSPSAVPSDS
jgi:hypothetical protein